MWLIPSTSRGHAENRALTSRVSTVSSARRRTTNPSSLTMRLWSGWVKTSMTPVRAEVRVRVDPRARGRAARVVRAIMGTSFPGA